MPLSFLASSKPSIYTCVYVALTTHRFQGKDILIPSYLFGGSHWQRPMFSAFLFHTVTFTYYRLIIRFSPSRSVIEYSTTMTSADFSRQALLHDFRRQTIHHVRETSSDKDITFPSYTYFIYTSRPEITIRNRPPFHFRQVLLLGAPDRLRHCMANGRLTLVEPLCTAPGACHDFSCVFGIYIQAFVAEAQVLPGSLPDRAHWPLPPSPVIPCHTHAGNVPESPEGTRVRPYRSFAESPVGTPLRSYRRQNHPLRRPCRGSVQPGTNGTAGQTIDSRHIIVNKAVAASLRNLQPKVLCLSYGQAQDHQPVCHLPALIQTLSKCP